MNPRVSALLLLSALVACGQKAEQAANESEPADRGYSYEEALSNPNRLAVDYDRDAGRKPAEILEFFGIEPGMTVLDMFSGGGYYSELISYVVGSEGKVVAHSNAAYINFVGDEFEQRHGGDRLANVEILMAENNELELQVETFDAVTLILSYHDIYHVDLENGWPKIDGPKLIAEIYKGMKPGAVLGVVDHYAEAGSPREIGNSLHRIDPGIVISELKIAGFVLEDKSSVLRNMEDDHSKAIFDPSVRGRTDRFALRFRKLE